MYGVERKSRGNLFRKGVNYFRNLVNLFRKAVNFFRKAILRNSTFCDRKLMRSSLGVLSVIGRCSLGKKGQGIRKGKEMAILIKVLFSILGFLGSS